MAAFNHSEPRVVRHVVSGPRKIYRDIVWFDTLQLLAVYPSTTED